MPYKHTVRAFASEQYYHIYNRSINKIPIFSHDEDAQFFINTIIKYLTPVPKEFLTTYHPLLKINEVVLVAYCLMPNHYHLLIRQNSVNGITRFMKGLSNSLVSYYNHKYKRTGPLFETRYKSIIIPNDSYLLELSRYIHRNPENIWHYPLQDYPYSSYQFYLNPSLDTICKPGIVLDQFSSTNQLLSYRNFVEGEAEIQLLPNYYIDKDLN